MKKIALITAAGVGSRMHQEIPKQFLNVNDKPIIIYTLEAFQKHPNIDAIEVVCLEGWHDILRAYCRQFGIDKLDGVVSGGSNGQESIFYGLKDISMRYNKKDIVLVHDGNRPLVSADVISDSISVCENYGNAVAVTQCVEAMLRKNTIDGTYALEQVDREDLKKTQTPHAFPLGTLIDMHKQASSRGIKNTVASCTMAIDLGMKVYFSHGSEKNFKITTMDDLDMFKAILRTE